jgi:3-oxoadipate enol-lactonase
MPLERLGISIVYEEAGRPEGLPVVFIHGFPFNRGMWTAQRDLLKSRYRTITYDQRGHGESPAGDGQFALEFLVDDLAALFDHLKLPASVLCGLSMGGYVALRFAEKYPERVRGLVLCDTRAEADSNEARLKRAASLVQIKEKGLTAFAEGFLKSVLTAETLVQHPEIAQGIREMIVGNSALGVAGTLLALAGRTDTSASLPAIRVPTLILVGEKDSVTPPSAAEALHAGIRDSTLHVIPKAAHLSNLENPEAFNRHLLAFLDTRLTDVG